MNMILEEKNIQDINNTFKDKLADPFSSLDEGFDTIRSILSEYDININRISDLDTLGDEFYIQVCENLHLYVIYVESNMDDYEFYASFVDDVELDAILVENEYLENEDLDGF